METYIRVKAQKAINKLDEILQNSIQIGYGNDADYINITKVSASLKCEEEPKYCEIAYNIKIKMDFNGFLMNHFSNLFSKVDIHQINTFELKDSWVEYLYNTFKEEFQSDDFKFYNLKESYIGSDYNSLYYTITLLYKEHY